MTTNAYCHRGYCNPITIKEQEKSGSLGEQIFNISAFIVALAASTAMIAFTYIA